MGASVNEAQIKAQLVLSLHCVIHLYMVAMWTNIHLTWHLSGKMMGLSGDITLMEIINQKRFIKPMPNR